MVNLIGESRLSSKLEERFSEFIDDMCFPFKWIGKMGGWSYSNFAKSYLIPRSLMDASTNRVAFFYAFVMFLTSRKLRKYKKRLIYGKKNKSFIMNLLFMFWKMYGLLNVKTKLFESLRDKGVVRDYSEFAFAVFTMLADVYHNLKHKDADTMREFEDFKRHLDFYLEIWRLELVESGSDDELTVKLLERKEGGI